MSTHSSSAPEREATPHTTNNTISDAVRRRAQSLINDRTIDASDTQIAAIESELLVN